MEVKVLLFAQLQELFDTPTLKLQSVKTVSDVENLLLQQQPRLSEQRYITAVNEVIVNASTSLKDGDVIALLPPFAGG